MEDFITSLDEINNQSVAVFPNPAQEEVNIVHSEWETAELNILDLQGKNIKSIDWYSGRAINIADTPAGIYFLSLQREGERLVTRIVVE